MVTPRFEFDGLTNEAIYWGARQPVSLTFQVTINADGYVESVTPMAVEPPDHPLAARVTPEVVRALRASRFEAQGQSAVTFSLHVRFDTRHPDATSPS